MLVTPLEFRCPLSSMCPAFDARTTLSFLASCAASLLLLLGINDLAQTGAQSPALTLEAPAAPRDAAARNRAGGAGAGGALAPGGQGLEHGDGVPRDPVRAAAAVLPRRALRRRRSAVQPGLDADQFARHRARRRAGRAPVRRRRRAGHGAGAEHAGRDGHAAGRAAGLPAPARGRPAAAAAAAAAPKPPPRARPACAAAGAARRRPTRRRRSSLRQAGGARVPARAAAGAGRHGHRVQLRPAAPCRPRTRRG